MGGVWQKEHEAAGRIASVARKGERRTVRETGARPTSFSVLLIPGPRPRNDVTHIQGVGLPFSVQPLWKLPQRCVSWVIAKLAKLMVIINCHTNITGEQVSGALWLGSIVHWPTEVAVFLHRKRWLF